jgi:molybdopterin-guanine dinucleotide biosynthesis protein A
VIAGVAILAGGEATRLPGKLELPAGDVPLVLRVLRNVRPGRETVIACKGSFSRALDAQLDVPLVVDRWSRQGPLSGLLSALAVLRCERVFALAGDAPFVDGAFLERLEAAWLPGDEAVVPIRLVEGSPQLEPLCALYERKAVLREGSAIVRSEGGSLRALVRRLQARFVQVDETLVFRNVNTASQYAELGAELARRPA